MADVRVRGEVLEVRFTRPERFWGLFRDLDVPVRSISAAAPVRRWREVRGFRFGTDLPRVWLTGRWYGRHRRQLVSLRRGQPAVHLWLRDQAYDELILSTTGADEVLEILRRRGLVSSGCSGTDDSTLCREKDE